MRRTARRKDKDNSQEGGFGVEDLAALIEDAARETDAQASEKSLRSSVDEKLMPLEGLIEAQLDFNSSVGSSIKIIAQHLLYVRKRFEVMEESQRRETQRSARTRAETTRHDEGMGDESAALVGRIDSLTLRLSELEERVVRELDEIRRSIRELGSTKQGEGMKRGAGVKRRNKKRG